MIDYDKLKEILEKIGDFCWNFEKKCEECPLKSNGGTSCIFMSPDFTNDTASNICYDEEVINEFIEILKKAEKMEVEE